MRMQRKYAALLAGAASAAALFALFALRTYPSTDFGIFYCAGQAVSQHADPYRVEPLRTCEHRVWQPGYLTGSAEPAALPGYALPPFIALSHLPFPVAKLLWLLVLCACFGAAVTLLTQLSQLNPVAVSALCVLCAGLLNVRVGQLGPVFLAGIAAAALLLRAGRPRWAALAALTTMIEPHVGLPAVASIAIFAPRSRIVIGGGLALLAALHVWILGSTVALEYVRVLLPAMAHAEIVASDQYGSAWALHLAGLPAGLAMRAATVLYVLVLAAAFAAVGHIRNVSEDGALTVALPVAAAALATPFLHDVELCGALVLPLAACTAMGRSYLWAGVTIALAVPWYASLDDHVLAAASVLAAGVFVALSFAQPPLRSILRGFGAAAACAAVVALLRALPLHPGIAGPHVLTAGTAPAPQSWGAFLRAHADLIAAGPRVIAPKLIAWTASLSCIVWLLQHRQVEPRTRKERAARRTAGLIAATHE